MRYTSVLWLALAILAQLMLGVSEAQARTWNVPDDVFEIREAVEDSAASGDTVLVSNNGANNDPYAAFSMKTGVRVLQKTGDTPKIAADASTHAVSFPSNASSSTILDGFIITGGDTTVLLQNQGIVRNCTIDSDGDATQFGIYHQNSTATIENVSIVLDNTASASVGILLNNSEATVKHCDVRVTNGSLWSHGIKMQVDVGPMAATVEDCFVYTPEGTGILATASGGTTYVLHSTVDSTYSDGIKRDDGTVNIAYCIASRIGGYGIVGSASNVSYCIAPSFSLSGGNGTGNSTADPLFCDVSAAEYTLRVDSYGNPGNNASGSTIGAFPVECMYGTL